MPARILVIEDNTDNLELLTFLLSAFGHTVLSAHDGVEGLEVARREMPDLILCDLQMPKLDGYHVARALRKDPRFAKCPLIAVSSYAMLGDHERGIEAGFDDYISKPIVPEQFVAHVERFLGSAQKSVTPPPPALGGNASADATPFRATILAVDNSQVNLDLMQSTLEPFGYRVRWTRSVSEALRMALADPPDLILSDLHMPDVDGYEFFEKMRNEPRLSSIPFVIISSTLWPATDRERALGLGVAKFVSRPVDPSQLLAEVEACLASRRRTDAP